MELSRLVMAELAKRFNDPGLPRVVYQTYLKAHEKRYRQHAAFRARILRMFEEKEAKIHELQRDWEIANYGDWRER
jgi:hypothetical protein